MPKYIDAILTIVEPMGLPLAINYTDFDCAIIKYVKKINYAGEQVSQEVFQRSAPMIDLSKMH